ncbi:MAG: transcriptional coactivator p15/PC4 family protein [bacterium]|nr:transcriptional coactivator p15/PC4 family protein [bacterium]
METIGTIKVSEGTEINFFIDQFKDVLYANIRKFASTEKYSGPTKQGIMLSHDNLKEIIKKIDDNIDKFKKSDTSAKETLKLDDQRYINIAITEFKEKKYFELREYLESEGYTGPTKKGITINTEHFEKVLEFLKKMDTFLANPPKDVVFENKDIPKRPKKEKE